MRIHVPLLSVVLFAGATGNALSQDSDVAQESDALKAALLLESSIVSAIERAEGSVVAVARVRRAAQDPTVGAPPPPFPRLFRGGEDPSNPDFVPNDFGAGVVIDGSGLILTTEHLIGDPTKSDFYVWSQKRPFKAKVVATDPWYDLAVLNVESSDLNPITFGDVESVKKGQIVLALGNPYAIARDGEVSASWGIVSNLLRRAAPDRQRSDNLTRGTLHHYGTLIQTDAKLNLGYSGGALVNLRGEMIGLTTSYAAASGFESAAGFAIPANEQFQRALKALKEGKKPDYGFLGVGPETLDASLRQNHYHGARVASVIPGTPAAFADVRVGDVISHINGRSIHDDDDLIRLVGSRGPEEVAVLTVVRGNLHENRFSVLQKTASLTKKYLRARRTQFGMAATERWRGMQVDYSTAIPNFDLIGPALDPEGCILVASVERDSSAWEAGMRDGEFITHVERRRVTKPREFEQMVAEDQGPVSLSVLTEEGERADRTISP